MWAVMVFLFLGGYWLLRGLGAGADHAVTSLSERIERKIDESRIQKLGEYHSKAGEKLREWSGKVSVMGYFEKKELAEQLSKEIYGDNGEKKYYLMPDLDRLMAWKEGYILSVVIWDSGKPPEIAIPIIKWRRDIIYQKTGLMLQIYEEIEKDPIFYPRYYTRLPKGRSREIE